ncbi:MAG: 30S ribosomal protein S20 [bacterium]
MKKSKSVIKNIRKSARRRKASLTKKRRMKDAIKKYTRTKTEKASEKMYPEVQSIIDKSIQDGLIKKNKAARYKSRLSKRLHKQK